MALVLCTSKVNSVFLSVFLISSFVILCFIAPVKSANLPGEEESNANLRIHLKRCPAAQPVTITYYESFYEQCINQVLESRLTQMMHPDKDKRINELISSYGYDVFSYNVTTDDGYILTVFRITGGRKSPSVVRGGKPVVMLHHGLLTSGESWTLQHGDKNLAFKLADAGYDVWLANARGTTYSRRHVSLATNEDTYWDYSFHEIGMYDLPALFRLILTRTRHRSLFFVGHSMGATALSIALSEMPELNQKVKAAFMLAPAVYIGHSYNPLRTFTSVVGTPMQNFIYNLFEGYFDPSKSRPLNILGISPKDFCAPSALRCGVCDNLLFFLYGYDAPQANYTNLPNVLSRLKNVSSLKTIIHFAQNLISCQFRQYDYGFMGNIERYGWYAPPAYKMNRITTPTYLFYGEGDNFVPPIDVEMTKDAMRPETVKGIYKVEWPLFNHIDFVVASDADILVYDKILEILATYNPYRP